jgi:hypothetical protein
MGMQSIIDAMLGSTGPERTMWLGRQNKRVEDAGRYYLGPAYDKVAAIPKILGMMTPAADMVDMHQSSADLMASRTPGDAARNLGWLGASTLAMALPGNVGMARQAAEEATQAAPKGIRAYHGSPHDFDRFDMGKIGTGEGGQLGGRGMNFTDNPAVADYYWEQLSGKRGKRYEVNIDASPDEFLVLNKPLAEQGEPVKAALSGRLNLGPVTPETYMHEGQGGIRYFSGGEGRKFGKIEQSGGGFHASVGKKSLGYFPDLEAAGDALRAESASRGIEWRGDQFRGQSAFDALGGRATGSETLRDLGVKGTAIDGAYGSAGESRDYVVFDESLISILRKYGLAGLLAGGAAMGSIYGSDQGNSM